MDPRVAANGLAGCSGTWREQTGILETREFEKQGYGQIVGSDCKLCGSIYLPLCPPESIYRREGTEQPTCLPERATHHVDVNPMFLATSVLAQ